MRFTAEGREYFVNHSTKATTWTDPRSLLSFISLHLFDPYSLYFNASSIYTADCDSQTWFDHSIAIIKKKHIKKEEKTKKEQKEEQEEQEPEESYEEKQERRISSISKNRAPPPLSTPQVALKISSTLMMS